MAHRTKHNLLTIDGTDDVYSTPKHWEQNNDAIEENLDRLEEEIAKLKEEVKKLKREFFQ